MERSLVSQAMANVRCEHVRGLQSHQHLWKFPHREKPLGRRLGPEPALQALAEVRLLRWPQRPRRAHSGRRQEQPPSVRALVPADFVAQDWRLVEQLVKASVESVPEDWELQEVLQRS